MSLEAKFSYGKRSAGAIVAAGVLGSVVSIYAAVAWGTAMSEGIEKSVGFRRVGGSYAGALSLRVVHGKGESMLVVSRMAEAYVGAQTTFAGLPVEKTGGEWKTIASIREIVPAMLAFDAADDGNGKVEIVRELPGGAINALRLNRGDESTSLSYGYPFESFSRPRFVKSSGAAPTWTTAVVDSHMCVALPVPQGGTYRELGACDDGLLVSVGTGFVFVSKTRVLESLRENAGRLRVARLDSSLKPLGPAVDVNLGIMYQFDAEFTDGKLVIVATTEGGVGVASASPADLRFTVRSYSASATLSYPAVLPEAGGMITLYALEGTGSATAHVVGARMQVP